MILITISSIKFTIKIRGYSRLPRRRVKMKVYKFVWEGGRMIMTLTLTMVLTLFLYFSWGFFCLLSVLLQKDFGIFYKPSFELFFIFLIIISFHFFIKKKIYEKYFLIFLIKIFFIKIFFIRIFSIRIRRNFLIVSNIIRNLFFFNNIFTFF